MPGQGNHRSSSHKLVLMLLDAPVIFNQNRASSDPFNLLSNMINWQV